MNRSGLLLVCLFLGAAVQAQAYVDPGSGATYYQLMLIGVVGVLFRLKRVIGWFRSRGKPGNDNQPTPDDERPK